jgi:hypothetical protein
MVGLFGIVHLPILVRKKENLWPLLLFIAIQV